MKEDYELPVDNRYEFGEVGFYTWSDAQTLCQEKGEGWDLAIIDDFKGKRILVTFWWQTPNFGDSLNKKVPKITVF